MYDIEREIKTLRAGPKYNKGFGRRIKRENYNKKNKVKL